MTKTGLSVLELTFSLVQDQAAIPPDSTLAANAETSTLLDIVLQGGWVMIPLALLSLLMFYLFFERLSTVRKAQTDPMFITDRTKRYVQDGDIGGAIRFCEDQDNPVSRILKTGPRTAGTSYCRDTRCCTGSGEIRSL